MNSKRLFNALRRRARRLKKHLFQYLNKSKSEKTVVFICGAQRSGTNMLFEMFDQLPFSRTYNENNPAAFKKYRIRPSTDVIQLTKGPANLFVFKPLMDSQNALQLLAEFPNSKILWIYRHFENVALSAAIKWKDAQRHIIREIATSENIQNRWYAQNLSGESIELTKKFYSDEISEESAGVLKWYLRNQLYFDLKLDTNPRVMLINYEDLVHGGKQQISRIEHFLSIKIDESAYSHVGKKGRRDADLGAIDKNITDLCTELYARLEKKAEKGE